MSSWKHMMHRFERKEIQSWSSLQKTAYLLLPLLIYLLVHDGAELLLWAGVELIMSFFGERVRLLFSENAYTVRAVIGVLATLVSVAVIGSGWKKEITEGKEPAKGKRAEGKWLDTNRVTNYCFLAALAFLTAVGINILFYQLGFVESSESFQEVRKVQYGVQFAVGLVLYGIISPFAEEAVFRGLIHNRMKRCFSYRVALVISSLLFGCYHGNLVQAVYGTILGFLIAYMYDQFESFAAPVLFHSVANISVYVMSSQNSLGTLHRQIALITATIMLAVAAALLFGIKFSLKKQKKVP